MGYKYTIQINQYAAIENGLELDIIDLAVFDYIKSFANSKSCAKVQTPEGEYLWISHQNIIDNLPLIGIKTKRGILKRLDNLIEAGLLAKHPDCQKYGKTLYTFGPKYDCIEFTPKNESSELSGCTYERKFLGGMNESSEGGMNESSYKHSIDKEHCTKEHLFKEEAKASKENAEAEATISKKEKVSYSEPSIFGDGQEMEIPFSKKMGITAEGLGVRPQVVKKIDVFYKRLVFPFDSDELKRNFFVLCCSKNWRTKEISSIQGQLELVKKYDEPFVIQLIKTSIANDWKALVYESTDRKYQEYLRTGGQTNVGGSTIITPMTEHTREMLEFDRQLREGLI